MAWIARFLLIIAGVVASWFIARDAVNFPVIQMVVALALIFLVVGALALWRRR